MTWSAARMKIGQDAAAAGVNQVILYKGAAGSEVVATELGGTGTMACTLGAATTANPSVVANAGALESGANGTGSNVIVTAWAFGATGTAYGPPNRFAFAKTIPPTATLTVVIGGLTENLVQLSGPPA